MKFASDGSLLLLSRCHGDVWMSVAGCYTCARVPHPPRLMSGDHRHVHRARREKGGRVEDDSAPSPAREWPSPREPPSFHEQTEPTHPKLWRFHERPGAFHLVRWPAHRMPSLIHKVRLPFHVMRVLFHPVLWLLHTVRGPIHKRCSRLHQEPKLLHAIRGRGTRRPDRSPRWKGVRTRGKNLGTRGLRVSTPCRDRAT
jgi:hypothetical protein